MTTFTLSSWARAFTGRLASRITTSARKVEAEKRLHLPTADELLARHKKSFGEVCGSGNPEAHDYMAGLEDD